MKKFTQFNGYMTETVFCFYFLSFIFLISFQSNTLSPFWKGDDLYFESEKNDSLKQSMKFSYHIYDSVTIRKNPTTQVDINIDIWPGNTFGLWLPEAVGELWQQWDADVAHQDFQQTRNGGLLWIYEGNPDGVIRTELIPQGNSFLIEAKVINRSQKELHGVYVQNCLHFSKAPDFACNDFSRIYIRTKMEWRSLKSLNPTESFPRYYREDYPSHGRKDPTEDIFGDMRQDAAIDHPLIILVSKDGKRSVGVASEDYEFLFHNQMEYLRCIHSESGSGPPLLPGEKAVFRQKIYFVEGGLKDCVNTFEKDIVGDPARSFHFNND